jgi:hypothetical protein
MKKIFKLEITTQGPKYIEYEYEPYKPYYPTLAPTIPTAPVVPVIPAPAPTPEIPKPIPAPEVEKPKELTPLQQLGITLGLLTFVGLVIGSISEILLPARR